MGLVQILFKHSPVVFLVIFGKAMKIYLIWLDGILLFMEMFHILIMIMLMMMFTMKMHLFFWLLAVSV